MSTWRRFVERIAARRPAGEDRAERGERPSAEERPTPGGEGGGRRRRGRRGGRGRGRGGSGGERTTTGTQEKQPEPDRSARAQERPRGRRPEEPERRRRGGRNEGRGDRRTDRDEAREGSYSWGRRATREDEARQEARRRQSGRRRRGYRSLTHLDQPLPEDIAFRSADEGGDRTILPSRRRRPRGFQGTSRILVGGTRLLTGFVRRSAEEPPREERSDERAAEREAPPASTNGRAPEPGAAPALEDREGEEALERPPEAPAGDELPAVRRRRGRRGGRGRRRAADSSAPEAADEQPAEPAATPTTGAGNGRHDLAPGSAEERGSSGGAIATRRQRARVRHRPVAEISPSEYPDAFRELGLDDRSLASMASFGFTKPTPIQEQSIPALLAGDDVVGLAQTGSGKTVAFGLPMVEGLDPGAEDVQGIVLVPTRELAQQVLEVLGDLGEAHGLRAIGLLGGRSLSRDLAGLREHPHIVVGTPGRIIDHLNRRTLSLRHVRYAVLDEADQMLDIGFLPDIRRIIGQTPKRRQTALFSATMPTAIRRLVWQFMRDPRTVSVDEELSTVESVAQVYVEVASRDKVRGLKELVDRELRGRTLVFCRMKRGVDRVARDLQGAGVRVGALHGDMDQRKRDAVVQRFRAGELDILIATNVAARGLDIPEITHVVNFDIPQNAEEYVHRIGRTGRAGREGKAITFVSEYDISEFETLRREFGAELQEERLELYI